MIKMLDTKKRINQFDGLRAIAIILVFLHHIVTKPIELYLISIDWNVLGQFLNYFTSSGVQLFYVLSGVLLLKPYLQKRRIFDTKKYFKRRIERLYPTYFVVLIITAIIFYITTEFPNWYSEKYMINFDLINFIKQLPIFHINSPYYNPVLWSLEIEVFFYFIIPVLVFIFVKIDFSKYSYWGFFIVLTILSTIIPIYLKWYNADFPYNIIFMFIYYSPCFFLGVILAKYDFSEKEGIIMFAVGIVYIILSLLVIKSNTPQTFSLFYGGLIIYSINNKQFAKKMSSKILVWIGERSYSLFIVHFPIILLANYLTSFFIFSKNIEYVIITRIMSILLSLIFTILVFHFVERKNAGKLTTSNQIFPFKI